LETEIGDLKSLTGIFPPPFNQMRSMTSFRGYPRETAWKRKEVPTETTQGTTMLADESQMLR
jgi:hypothetical protein